MSRRRNTRITSATASAFALLAIAFTSTNVLAEPLAYGMFPRQAEQFFRGVIPEHRIDDEAGQNTLPQHLQRRIVPYSSSEAPGTIIVDTPNTYLYYVVDSRRAIRYGIGVGREGFTWSGVKTVGHKSEWPDWFPPPEMIQRQPYLPRVIAGGPQNPLGARAIYLSGTLYRIHGTNAPETIGRHVSSGCIRMLNDSVVDLYSRIKIGTRVVVLPMTVPHRARNLSAIEARSSNGIY